MNVNDYEDIVRKHSPAIYRYCLFKLNNDTHSAEDATSEVMLLLFQKWDKLDTDDNIRAWLYRTADNLIKRKRAELHKHLNGTVPIDELANTEAELYLAKEDEYFADDDTVINDCIRLIKRDFGEEGAELFSLRYVKKKTLSEISEEFNIPLSTLHYRLFRIEKTIRKIIE